MRTTALPFVSIALLTILLPLSLRAATIATWTFDSNPTLTTPAASPGNLTPEVGSGTATALHADATTAWTKPTGNGSAISISATKWGLNDYWQFQVDTTGQSGIVLDWDQASSATGPRDFALQYSTDGTNFTQFGSTVTVITNASPPGTWSSGTFRPQYHYARDLSSITEIDNFATVYFRLTVSSTTSTNGGTIDTAGASRIDTFSVTTVPEPATLISYCVGFSLLLSWRQRSIA